MTVAEAGIVGPGRIGLSLAAALQDSAEFDGVWVAGRRPGRPEFLEGRDEIGYAAADRWLREPPDRPSGDLVLIFCVPDDAIREVAGEWGRGLAGAGLLPSGPRGEASAAGPTVRAALHTSGSRPASDLEPLGEETGGAGPAVGCLHPLCAVARPDPGAFRGVTFGIEGDDAAADLAAEIAAAVGGRSLRVAPGRKARYHAGAVLASNLLVTCLSAGVEQVRQATGGAASVSDLMPLAHSALQQVDRHGPAAGLTGPVVRGDAGTVRAHLEALDPSARALYASLTEELLRQAEVEPDVRRAVEELLAGDGGPSA